MAKGIDLAREIADLANRISSDPKVSPEHRATAITINQKAAELVRMYADPKKQIRFAKIILPGPTS